MSTTAITDFYETIRFVMGDNDASVQVYPDSVLLKAVRSVIKLNKVPDYAVTEDGLSLTPAVSDANDFALVVFHVCRAFVAGNPDRYSYRTRAIGESFGSWKDFLATLEMDIHKLENGTMFSGWQSYYSFMAGISGLPVQDILTRFKVNAPFQSATLSQDGFSTE